MYVPHHLRYCPCNPITPRQTFFALLNQRREYDDAARKELVPTLRPDTSGVKAARMVRTSGTFQWEALP